MLITLSVLDARFPDYWAIVPQSPTTVCTVETKVFENVLKVATIFARENANIVYLTIKPADNQIIVTAKSADNGDTSCELPAEEINGPGLEIAFNVGYLKQMLTHINDSKLKIELTQTTRPGRFYAASEERENCIYVIMPMHPPR
jgi:DNA polymerase-3 subunit beta